MDLHAEKLELIKLVLETEKESLIYNLKEILINDIQSDEYELMDSHKLELDRRLLRMKNGETKFYSWEEVEEKLKSVL